MADILSDATGGRRKYLWFVQACRMIEKLRSASWRHEQGRASS
jgi:hypothetical protein